MDLEKEIEEASERIESKKLSIDAEVSLLDEKITTFTSWAWRFVWAGIIVTIFGIIFYLCKNSETGYGLNLLGDFMAGTVASVWSLAGLFFIYVAFLGQKQQLLNQQLELMYSQLEVKYTRLELRGQKEEMRLQNETMKLQKFENTFFQMLTLLNSIVNSLDLRNRKTRQVTTSGRDCFEIFEKRFRGHLSKVMYGAKAISASNLDKATVEQAVKAYDKLYSNDRADMSHYFRTIYHIIKFIDRSDVKNKKQYIAIARAQLSSYEQIILFYNCLHINGKHKFKPLIEKYSLFKNIDDSLIINSVHLDEYADSAYGK